MLKITDLSKRFGSHGAVNNISLTINAGEFFSIVGPSGCGKTTLLKMLAGFHRPDSGTLSWDGQDITATPPEKRPFNMVFQKYALFPHLNVRQNVSFGLEVKKIPKNLIQEKVDHVLSLVCLKEFESRNVAALSGGQQQRVALARALVNEPKALLLDECLSALDRQLRKQMHAELRHLQKTLGITFIFVTHDQEEALSLSDRIAVMNGGELEQVGTPEDIYDEPASEFVARFVGTMNHVPALALKRYGLISVLSEDTAMVRPEKLRIDFTPEYLTNSNDVVSLPGVIKHSFCRGDTMEVIVDADDVNIPDLSVTMPRSHNLVPMLQRQPKVSVQWNVKDTLLFKKHG